MENHDSDDEGDIPFFLKPTFSVTCEDNDITATNQSVVETQSNQDFFRSVETYWFSRDTANLKLLLTPVGVNSSHISLVTTSLQVLNGAFANLFSPADSSTSNNSTSNLLLSFINNTIPADVIRSETLLFIKNSSYSSRTCTCLELLFLATALLEAYCQQNYTGPELAPRDINILLGTSDDTQQEKTFKHAINQLECDGNYPFLICSIPQILFVARCVLSTLANPTLALWRSGVILTYDGSAERRQHSPSSQLLPSVIQACSSLKSSCFINARASLIHLRLLQEQQHEHVPSLWIECRDCFQAAIDTYAPCMRHINSEIEAKQYIESLNGSAHIVEPEVSNTRTSKTFCSCSDSSIADMLLEGQLWLEYGLCQHFFGFKDKVKVFAGMNLTLSTCLGLNSRYALRKIIGLYNSQSFNLPIRSSGQAVLSSSAVCSGSVYTPGSVSRPSHQVPEGGMRTVICRGAVHTLNNIGIERAATITRVGITVGRFEFEGPCTKRFRKIFRAYQRSTQRKYWQHRHSGSRHEWCGYQFNGYWW